MIGFAMPAGAGQPPMLSGENIICFTFRPWHSTWKTDQQIMSRLARSNRVLYVNPLRSLRAASLEILGRAPRKPVIEARGQNLYLYQEPVLLPGWGRNHLLSRAYNRIAEPIRLAHARDVAKRLGFRSPILWSYNPLASRAIGSFGEKTVVYCVIDNYDEYFSIHEVWQTLVRRTHREMMRRAHVVFAVSERLLEQCLQYNPNSYLVPNGVSYELFEAAMRNGVAPPDVLPIPRPIIGYVGVLHSVIDFGLLEKIADDHSDWSLMLVGPVEGIAQEDLQAFRRLCSRANVYHLGAKRPEVLPDYVKCCDVGLMPYRINSLTSYSDSQKLYEYMACGRPVVSTAIPSARRFLPLIESVDDSVGFMAAIERALKQPDGLREARTAVARDSSWDRRVGEMSAILARYLGAEVAPVAV